MTSFADWGIDFLVTLKEEMCAFSVQRDRMDLELDCENYCVDLMIMRKKCRIFKTIVKKENLLCYAHKQVNSCVLTESFHIY